MRRLLSAVVIASVAVVYGPAQILHALSLQDYMSNNMLHLGPAESTCSNTGSTDGGTSDDFSSPKPITLTGANNAEKIMNFLIGQGFPLAAASGIMGNFSVESNFDPTIENPIGATGLAQWLDDRLSNLKSYGGSAYKTLEVQVQFMMHELNTTEAKSMGIKTIASPEDAATFWEKFYERPEPGSTGARSKRAGMIFNEWQTKKSLSDAFLNTLSAGGGTSTNSTNSLGGPACPSSTGGSVFLGTGALDGYAMPISAKSKSDFSTFGGALSRMPCSSGCHHDGTPAYDLGVLGFGTTDPEPSLNPNPIGAPVYAISDGTITVRHDNAPGPRGQRIGCTQFTLNSSKDSHNWWYGHLALQGAAVNKGQQVSKGQLLGYVGNSTCADMTMPHLHIDSGGGTLSDRNELVYTVVNGLYKQMPAGDL